MEVPSHYVKTTKTCSRCEQTLLISEFGTFIERRIGKSRGANSKLRPEGGRLYYNARCKSCARKATNEYNRNNRALVTKHRRDSLYRLRDIVYEHYGARCSCCGESEISFLTIDHMDNDGHLHRKRVNGNQFALYRSIINDGFPDNLQVACYNCNCGRVRNNGVCPHGSS